MSAVPENRPEARPPARPRPAALKRKIAAILAADVAGYSRLVAEAEERTLHDLAAAREVFDGIVDQAGGRIFNTAGDSVMCEFDSAVEAVRTAIEIQARIAGLNAGTRAGRRLEFRMGITIGDVVEREGDLLGEGVNIASRLEGLAPPGGICVSRSVHEAVANKVETAFRDMGERKLKNIPQAVHAYLIAPPAGTAERPAERRPFHGPSIATNPTRLRKSRLMVAGAVLLALVVSVPGIRAVRDALRDGTAETSVAETTAETAVAPGPSVAASPPANEAATPRATSPQAPPRTATKPAMKPSVSTAPAPVATAPAAMAPDGITPAERYRAARELAARGDRAGAAKAYATLLPHMGDVIDPAMRYASLLRQDGEGAARKPFADLARSTPTRPVTLVAALQLDPAERRARLEALAAADPDYAPASYLLAIDHVAGRDGGPTLTERRLAFDLFDQFVEASESGRLDPFFLDLTVRASWIEEAKRRRAELQAFFAGTSTRPVASFARSETGWIASFALPEPATAVSVRVGERGEFVSTGLSSSPDPKTGRPAPSARMPLPASMGRTTLYVQYADRSGREAGPFAIAFDPATALVSAGRETLERFPDTWVTFRRDVANVLSYAQLVSNRCAIRRALIGYGDEPPHEAIALPACDAGATSAVPTDTRPVMTLPDGVEAVQVQLAYADGTESPVRTFRR